MELSSAGGGGNEVDGGGHFRIDVSHLQPSIYFMKNLPKVLNLRKVKIVLKGMGFRIKCGMTIPSIEFIEVKVFFPYVS